MKAILLSFLLLVPFAQARIGESLAECETRYGPVVEKRPSTIASSDGEACVFSKEGITITIHYRNDKAWHVSYRMTTNMLESLLGAVAPEGGWSAPIVITGQEMRIATAARDICAIVTFPPVTRKQDPATLTLVSRGCGKAQRENFTAQLKEMPALLKLRNTGSNLKSF